MEEDYKTLADRLVEKARERGIVRHTPTGRRIEETYLCGRCKGEGKKDCPHRDNKYLFADPLSHRIRLDGNCLRLAPQETSDLEKGLNEFFAFNDISALIGAGAGIIRLNSEAGEDVGEKVYFHEFRYRGYLFLAITEEPYPFVSFKI